MAIDKTKAEQLRLEGKTHQEIADELGCSVGWCKKNLKGVKQANEDKQLIEIVRQLGRSAQGVTTGEIKLHTIKKYPELKGKDLEDKVQDIRKQARRHNPDVIVRPYWMLPQSPQDCTTTMLEYSQELYYLRKQLADKYLQTFDLDSTYRKTVEYTLSMMSVQEKTPMLPQGLQAYVDTLSKVQDALDSRNNPDTAELPEYIAQDESLQEIDYEQLDMPESIFFDD